MKNVCIVGYGAIGPVHASAMEAVESARLYAVCDPDPEMRKAFLEEYGPKAKEKGLTGLKEYDDFDRMLLDEDIHSVHICTPHYLHFEMIKKALAAGKDVVVEKPVTISKEEYAQLLKLEGSDRVCVVLQNRLNPCVQKLRELVQSGELGAVKTARAVLTWYRSKAYYQKADWRGKWATEGGGLLINQAVHTLDYFYYLMGDMVSVKTMMANFSLEDVIEVEDTLAASITLASGAKGIFFATNAYTDNDTPFFEMVFEKGKVRYTDRQLVLNGEVIAEDVAATIGKAYWGSGHAGLLKRFYDEHKYFSVHDAQNTMETVFAMYQSAAAGGKEIEIN